ncbi:MAG: hypothetical protein JJV98_14910, partial [Desulfosarcina sp.]|nr:hypothetical protein [Desulfobacterales bacterium]
VAPPEDKPGQFPDDNGFEAQDQDAGGAESQPLADVKVETPPPELAAAVPPPPPERPEIVPEAEPSEIDRTNLTVVTSTRIPENETGFQPSSEKISGKPERSAETLPSRPKPSPPEALQPDRPVAVAAARKEPKSVPDTSPPPIPEPPSPEPDDAISELTSVERLEVFLETYCRAYSTKDLSRFTDLFTENAIERDVRFTELIPTYRANFEKLEAIDYQIDLQAYTESADGREVQVKGKFRIQYRLAGRDWKTSRGDIEMDLVKLENSFRVKRLDYRKQK